MEEKVIQTLSRQRDSGTIVELVENEAGFRFVVKRVQNLEAPIYRAIFLPPVELGVYFHALRHQKEVGKPSGFPTSLFFQQLHALAVILTHRAALSLPPSKYHRDSR